MEECCDICGSIGYKNLLLTCYQCKLNREHMYCTPHIMFDCPPDWICEECKLGPSKQTNSVKVHTDESATLPTQIQKLPNVSRKVSSFRWEKRVKTGKTKYIPVIDAIKLSLETNVIVPTTKILRQSSPLWRKISPRPKLAPLTFSSKQVLSSTSSSKKLKRGKVTNTELPQVQKPQKLTGANGSNHVKLRTIRKENLNGNVFPGSEKSHDATAHENLNAIVLPDLEKSLNAPAPDTTWNGGFCIWDDRNPMELNPEVQAQPPNLVHRKVYEFSKKMPNLLHLELVPLEEFLPKLFPEDIPDDRDIGLYFFPRDSQSSEDYTSLLKCISVKKLALKIQFDDVELLVFPSEVLSRDCQCWEGKKFLWGVFRTIKKSVELVQEVTSTNDANYSRDKDNDREEDHDDMEIDMIGGVNVGIIDVAVQKEVLTSYSEESATATEIISTSSNKDSVSEVSEPTEPCSDMDIDMIGGVNVGRIDIAVQREGIKETSTSVPEESATTRENIGAYINKDSVFKVPKINKKSEPSYHDLPPGFDMIGGVNMGIIDAAVQNEVVQENLKKIFSEEPATAREIISASKIPQPIEPC